MSSRRTHSSTPSKFNTTVNAHLEARTLAHAPELLTELFAMHQLGEYHMIFEYFTRDEASGYYHGKEHAFVTALNCYEGALHSHCTYEETRALLVAGLFHDVGHSRGANVDSINVARAKNILTQLHANMGLHARLKETEIALCLHAIGATQYPYRTKLTDTVAKVIRDADMMASYLPNAPKLRLLNGLRREIADQQGHVSVARFCEMQLAFSSALVWNTRWGSVKAFQHNWPLLNRSLPALFQTLPREEQRDFVSTAYEETCSV